jgi:DNA modification methylase
MRRPSLKRRGSRARAPRIEVIYRAIAELAPDPRNPRSHSAKQIRQIGRSIETFGFIVPVLVDSHGRVIAGHARTEAAKLLGWNEVPTICLGYLNEAQARAFLVADNRLSEISVWNEQLLAQQLKELSVADLGFNLEVIGFDMGEIDLRIESLTSVAEAKDDPADAIPTATDAPAVSRKEDRWLLGEHHVFCGNALDESAYERLMGKEKAAMVFTDPPYNVPINGNVSGLGAIHHREFAMASGEMSASQFASFLIRACLLLAQNSADGSLHYIFIDWRHLGELLAAGRTVYSSLINLCVWVKNHTGMGTFYRSRHELIFVFRNGSARSRNNVKLGRYGRDRSNVWLYPSPRTPSEEGNLLALHPTVKPCALVADAIIDCTSRNDIVLDGFLGSGTTVIAAERTGRRCYGLEIDPLYVDIIVRRWQAFTRGDARHALTGKSFREMEAEARRCEAKRKTATTK